MLSITQSYESYPKETNSNNTNKDDNDADKKLKMADTKMYWKLALVLPEGFEDSLSEWLISKMSRGSVPQPESYAQVRICYTVNKYLYTTVPY